MNQLLSPNRLKWVTLYLFILLLIALFTLNLLGSPFAYANVVTTPTVSITPVPTVRHPQKPTVTPARRATATPTVGNSILPTSTALAMPTVPQQIKASPTAGKAGK